MSVEAGSIVINTSTNIRGAVDGMKSLEQTTKSTASRIQNNLNSIKTTALEGSLNSLSNTMKGLFVGGTLAGMAQVGIQFDSIRASLKAITGSAEGANDAFKYLQENSKNTGVNILASARDFRILAGAAEGTSFSMDFLKQAFSSVSAASTVLGLRADDVSGIMRAFGQMMSKGTVQAEELKGQIGDRLPGALGKASRAMGVTNAQLLKMMENGELISSEFLPRFVKVLEQDFAGKLTESQQTTLFAMQSITNEYLLLQDRIMNDTGLNEMLREVTLDLANFLKTIDIESVKDFGDGLKIVVDFLRENSDALEVLIAGFVTYKAMNIGKDFIATGGAVKRMSDFMSVLAIALDNTKAKSLDQALALDGLRMKAMTLATSLSATLLPMLAVMAYSMWKIGEDARKALPDVQNLIEAGNAKNMIDQLSKINSRLFQVDKDLAENQDKFFKQAETPLIKERTRLLDAKKDLEEALRKVTKIKPADVKPTKDADFGGGAEKTTKAQINAMENAMNEINKIIATQGFDKWGMKVYEAEEKFNKWVDAIGSKTPKAKEALQILFDEIGKDIEDENLKAYEDKIKTITEEINKLSMSTKELFMQGYSSDKTLSDLFDKKKFLEDAKELEEENKKINESFKDEWSKTFDTVDVQRQKWVEEQIKAGVNIVDANKLATEKFKTDWDKAVDDMGDSTKHFQSVFTNAMSGMEDALVNMAKTGKINFKDLANAIMEDLLRMTIRMTITRNLMAGMSGFWGGSPVPVAGEVSSVNANGNVFDNSGIQKFAKGGTFTNSIVSKPTLFKFAKGTGLMGEAGAEAIMPLTRDSSGKLGVQANGVGGGVDSVKVEVINQSSQQIQASNVSVRSDQEGMIIGIIVNDIQRGGATYRAIRG